MGMIAVSGNNIVVVAHGSDRAGHHRFLPTVEVTETPNLLRLILLAGAFLKPPDQQHQRQHLDFVALLHRLHGGQAVPGTAARARGPSARRPRLMKTTNRAVHRRTLMTES